MDARTAEHVFEPFFTTKAPGKGSGLGLSVVHGIMKACNGLVTLHSQPGAGTTFHLYFPASDNEAVRAMPSASDLPMGHGKRVLLIDDDTTLTTLGERFLLRLGYRPEVSNNAVAAITRFKEETYDLVLTDLSMPFATRLDVARDCHACKPRVPILLMTGFQPDIEADVLKSTGIVGTLSKPYTLETFAKAIQTALQNQP